LLTLLSTLFLSTLVQVAAPVDSGLYRPGDGRRPYGRLPVEGPQTLLATLQDKTAKSEERLGSLEVLVWWQRPLPLEAVRGVRHLSRGDWLPLYASALTLCGPEAVEELEGLAKRRQPEVRAEVQYGLVLLADDGQRKALELLSNRRESPLVRVAALRGLADRGSPLAHVEALRRLQIEEDHMLLECLSILRRDPSEDDVGPLIDLLADNDGRVANEAVELLQNITGYRIGPDARSWKHFMLKHIAEGTPFRAPAEAPGANLDTLSYLGIPILSHGIAFVLDASSSMTQTLPDQRQDTRATRAVKEFVGLLPKIPEKARFNVVFFESELLVFRPEQRQATLDTKAAAQTFVQEMLFEGGTNLYGGLEEAFADEGLEEIILLSDGAPSVGNMVQPGRILARVARWNRWRHVRISTISFGASATARAFLYRLSAEHEGYCRVID